MKSKTELKEIVKKTYGEIAEKKSSGCGCGCSETSLQALEASAFSEDYSAMDGYHPDADLNLGCGIPTDIIEIREGQTVVDLGSGAGNDCFVAGRMVGEKGMVIGVDMTKRMVELAKENARKLGVSNVKFRYGEIEDLPITANKADVIISNCVINLVPDKHAAFNEIIRVLKPEGYFSISDIVVEGSIPQVLRDQASLYAGCVSGAISLNEYLTIMQQTGFVSLAVRKRKKLQLPDSLLQEVLTDSEYQAYQDSEIGIYSVTIYGEKPARCC